MYFKTNEWAMRSFGRLALGFHVALPSAISLTIRSFFPRLCPNLNVWRKSPTIQDASWVAKTAPAPSGYLVACKGRSSLTEHAPQYSRLPQEGLFFAKNPARQVYSGDHVSMQMSLMGSSGDEAVSPRLDDGLNPSQREAVRADVGPVRVVAGPGSGKTRVLTRRISHLVRELGAPAWSILAVTFTKKAAEEMRSRVQEELGGEPASQVTMGTFHSVCARILRRHGSYLASVIPGLDGSFSIFDRDDSRRLLSNILTAEGIQPKEGESAADILRNISRLKSRGKGPEDIAMPSGGTSRELRDQKRFIDLYSKYQHRLLRSNALDFDDLILVALKILRQNEDVFQAVGRQYRHVLVDEWQDTNGPQYDLVLTLANAGREAQFAWEESQRAAAVAVDEAQRGPRGPGRVRPSELPPASVFIVGDADQCIYHFRGAEYSNVARFEEDFAGCRTVLLRENYRSSANIARSATAVIAKVKDRMQQPTKSVQGDGLPIGIMRCSDSAGEASAVASQVEAYLKSGRVPAAEMAVLYRTNAQSRSFEETFRKKSLPFVVIGAQRFYERREVKDCLVYLRVVANPRDVAAMRRAINTPPRGIGEKTKIALEAMVESAQGMPELDSVTHSECLMSLLNDQELGRLQGTFVSGDFKGTALEGVLDGGTEARAEAADGEGLTAVVGGWQSFSIERVRLVRDGRAAGKIEGPTPAQSKKLAMFARLLCELRVVATTKSVSDLLSTVLRETDMETYVLKDSKATNFEAQDRWQNIRELEEAVEHPRFDGVAAEGALDAFLNEVVLMSREDTPSPSAEGGSVPVVGTDGTAAQGSSQGSIKPQLVQLMTCHASKGLEFNTVFLAGLEQGTFPSELAGRDGEDEERRLMYVSMTRAKERLFLSWREKRLVFSRERAHLKISSRSSFLDDVPREIVRSIDKTTPDSVSSLHSPARGRGKPSANRGRPTRSRANTNSAGRPPARKGSKGHGNDDALEEVTRLLDGVSPGSSQGSGGYHPGGRRGPIGGRSGIGDGRPFRSAEARAAGSFREVRDKLEHDRYPVPSAEDSVARLAEESGVGIDMSWAAELGESSRATSVETSHLQVGARVSHPVHGAGEVVAMVEGTGMANVRFVSRSEPFVARVTGSRLKVLE